MSPPLPYRRLRPGGWRAATRIVTVFLLSFAARSALADSRAEAKERFDRADRAFRVFADPFAFDGDADAWQAGFAARYPRGRIEDELRIGPYRVFVYTKR